MEGGRGTPLRMPPPHESNRLPRAVIVIGWISLLTDVAGEMIYPVLPLFLMTLTGRPGLALGIIEGGAEALVALMKGFSGWHSDRAGCRVPYIRWGYGASALSKPLIAMAGTWAGVFGARLLDRLGKGLRGSARDALLADVAGAVQRGRVFGFHSAMDTAGAAIGVLLATALLWGLPGQYRLIIALGLLPGLVAVGLTALLDEPAPVSAQRSADEEPHVPFSAPFITAAAALVVFGLANSSDTFLLLRVRASGWPDWQVGLAYAGYNLMYAAAAYPLGRLSDRVGRWPVMVVGWMLYALVYAGFASFSGNAYWGLFAAYGLYMALTDGAAKALLADLAPPSRKGTALGAVSTGVGLANLVGSVAAGVLFDRVGPAAPFWLGCGGTALALLLLACAWAVRRRATREAR